MLIQILFQMMAEQFNVDHVIMSGFIKKMIKKMITKNLIKSLDLNKNISKTLNKPKDKTYKPSFKEENLNDRNYKISKKSSEIVKYIPNSNLTFVKFLSYILVFIISFIGLIIILDTFKSSLYNLFPNLEFLLFSLYETLKDIELFIKDLFYFFMINYISKPFKWFFKLRSCKWFSFIICCNNCFNHK